MKDRLESLRAQRALIIQHLSWIDSEITSCGNTPPREDVLAPPVTQTVPPTEKAQENTPDLALAEFEVNRQSVHGEVRNEIFLYTGIVAFLLASLVIYVTFFY